MDYGVIWLAISLGFLSWGITLEMVISSDTVIIVTFCDWETPERNMVVCELMASLQLLWQLVPGHQHTLTWNRPIILSCNLLLYIYCHWYTWILHCIIFVCSRVFVAVNKIVNSTPEVPHPSLNLARFGLGCNTVKIYMKTKHGNSTRATLFLCAYTKKQ